MVSIQVLYEGDLHCQATHGPSSNQLTTDAPVDNQGRGESFSPTDLVGTALGTCILTVMDIAARKRGLDLTGAHATVEKTMATAPERRIAMLAVEVHVPCSLGEEDRAFLEQVARTCPVEKSLHPELEVPVTFHWGAPPA